MDVLHALELVERDDLADRARAQDAPHLGVERVVAQAVAHAHDPARLAPDAVDLDAVVQRGRHRLLQQHVVAAAHRGDRRGDVLAIHRGVDRDVREARFAEQLLPGRVAWRSAGIAVHRRRSARGGRGPARPPRRPRPGPTWSRKPLGEHAAASARAEQNEGKRAFHNVLRSTVTPLRAEFSWSID